MAIAKISHEAGNTKAWICICKNAPILAGFYPCNKLGNDMEPIIRSDWRRLYVCAASGRIIDQETLLVVGKSPKAKRLI